MCIRDRNGTSRASNARFSLCPKKHPSFDLLEISRGRARRENETAQKSAFDIKRGILQQPIAVRERESFRSNQREKEQSCLPRLESEGDVLRHFVIKVVIIRGLAVDE